MREELSVLLNADTPFEVLIEHFALLLLDILWAKVELVGFVLGWPSGDLALSLLLLGVPGLLLLFDLGIDDLHSFMKLFCDLGIGWSGVLGHPRVSHHFSQGWPVEGRELEA